MTVLEDLYYGNIVPQARSYRHGSPQKQRQEAVSDLESKLNEKLDVECLQLFRSFVITYAQCLGDAALDAFIVGFRLGTRMTWETFLSDDATLQSI